MILDKFLKRITSSKNKKSHMSADDLNNSMSKSSRSTPSLTLYSLFYSQDIPSDGTVPPEPRAPITFATTKEQMYLAIDRILFFRYYDHYVSWCDIHGHKEIGFDAASWREYAQTVIDSSDPDNKFTIMTQRYDATDIATVMRLFTVCRPLFLNYEFGQVEYMNYMAKDPDDAERYFSEIAGIEPKIDDVCTKLIDDYANSLEEEMITKPINKDDNKKKKDKFDA